MERRTRSVRRVREGGQCDVVAANSFALPAAGSPASPASAAATSSTATSAAATPTASTRAVSARQLRHRPRAPRQPEVGAGEVWLVVFVAANRVAGGGQDAQQRIGALGALVAPDDDGRPGD